MLSSVMLELPRGARLLPAPEARPHERCESLFLFPSCQSRGLAGLRSAPLLARMGTFAPDPRL
eukprot:10482893-Alexandrium_andersonii.AAC.1